MLLGSLAVGLLVVVLLGLAAASDLVGLLGLAVAFPVLCWHGVASIAVTVRRLHDIERSGWYALGFAFPPLGVVLLAILLAKDGDVELNRYGVSPKYF